MTKLEEIAQALKHRTGDLTDAEAMIYARAAVEAMREPTEAMVDAAPDSDITDHAIKCVWVGMIDAILSEAANPKQP